ncbi:Ig-like domain-containing protein [Bacillus sp. CGMCC 1.16607]|uniref:Ig-like domain-containing protein n=1 Tax=Bacillus sp. CGMCC 1.16607 TaxID=3351842 RepID=UPI003639DEDA
MGVSATNLKEVVVEFDGTVDVTSAEDVSKYSVDSSVQLDTATVLADGKSVRLTVKEVNSNVLQNQHTYKVTVKNVKAGDKTVSASGVAFTPVDNTLPAVESVRSLGTKAIKVSFSEPIKTASVNNFKLDGKSFFGSVTEGGRSLVLKPYTTTDLSVGTHKLEVSGVEDYANFKSLSSTSEFEVVEDTTAPTIKEVKATLESVTVTFSEEVDPDTVTKGNVYWMSGTDKKAAGSVTQLTSDTFKFDFTANALPGYETTLNVEGVKDYTGNKITETQVKVKADVDQTRPEVTEVGINKLNDKNITVKFSKQVKIEDVKYFTLTDSAGDIVPLKQVTGADGTSSKVFTLETYNSLDDSYTLKIVGVRDTTKLQNTMNDFTTTLNGEDVTQPSYTSNSANNATRTLIINFDEKMDLATLADHKNYLVTINNKSQQLPSGTEVSPTQDGKAVRIVFPQYIDNALVGINDSAKGANVTAFKLLALKDVAGNIISNFGSADIAVNTTLANIITGAYDSNSNSKPAKMTAKGVVKVKFDQPIGKAVASDFVVTGGTGVSVSSVDTDGSNVVTINLTGNLNKTGLFDTTGPTAITLAVAANNKITTTSGNGVVQSQTGFAIHDAVKPTVELGSTQTRLNIKATTTDTIELPFSENLATAPAANYKYDLIVKNVRTGAILSVDKYTTAVTNNILEINLDETQVSTSDEYSVYVKKDASFIQDNDGNKASESGTYLSKVGGIDTSLPTFTASTVQTAASLKLFSGVTNKEITVTAAAENVSYLGAVGNALTVEIVANADNNADTLSAVRTGDTIVVTLADDNTDALVAASNTATLIAAAIDAIDGVTASVTNGNGSVSAAAAVAQASLAGGTDVLTLDFSEAYLASSIDTTNANTDFAITSGGAVTVTATTATTDADTLTITVTAANKQVKNAKINAKATEVTDLAGNAAAAGTLVNID